MTRRVEIIVVTDRSGSMTTIAGDCNGGFDEFIKKQQAEPGECRVTMIKFDDKIETEYTAKPLAEVPPLNLQPRGSTALLDALGMALAVHGERIAKEKWADLVIVPVITDGQENASREYMHARIKEMIQHAEKNGWNFVFLAADQDAFSVARSYGMANVAGQTFSKNAVGTKSMYDALSSSTAQLRATGKVDKQAPTL